MAGQGDNSGGLATERLKAFIERVERLTEEKDAMTADIREIFSEAKSTGFDVKIMRMIIKLRAMDENDRKEQAALLDMYKQALDL